MSLCIHQPRAPIRVARARRVPQPSRATWLVVRQVGEVPGTSHTLAACCVDPRRASSPSRGVHTTRGGPEGWCVCGEDRAPRERPCRRGRRTGGRGSARGARRGRIDVLRAGHRCRYSKTGSTSKIRSRKSLPGFFLMSSFRSLSPLGVLISGHICKGEVTQRTVFKPKF